MKNKIIELTDGKQFIVADTIENGGRLFLLVAEVIPNTETVSDDFEIYETIKNVNSFEIVKVEDENLSSVLMKAFESKNEV